MILLKDLATLLHSVLIRCPGAEGLLQFTRSLYAAGYIPVLFRWSASLKGVSAISRQGFNPDRRTTGSRADRLALKRLWASSPSFLASPSLTLISCNLLCVRMPCGHRRAAVWSVAIAPRSPLCSRWLGTSFTRLSKMAS